MVGCLGELSSPEFVMGVEVSGSPRRRECPESF